MLPEQWGDRLRSPRWFVSDDEWDETYARYAAMLRPVSRGRSQLAAIWQAVRDAGAERGLLESEYIDADYRDEYAHFYATVYRALPDRAERLHFWRAPTSERPDGYLGYTVLRPVLERPVGRTLIRPPAELEAAVSCRARFQANAYGFDQTVEAFPFMQQDRQFGVCAHAAIWSVSLYYHARHGAPRRYLSDIVAAAARHRDLVRPTPSGGLYARQIAAIVDDLGFSPIIYTADRLPHGETLQSLACRYLAGGIPLLLLTPGHASVLVGYHNVPDGVRFVVSDDARRPYRPVDGWAIPAGERWEMLIAPLPGRIYLAAENARITAQSALVQQLRASGDDPSIQIADDLKTNAGGFRLHTYAVTAADYRRQLRRRPGFPVEATVPMSSAPSSHWLWITELHEVGLAPNESVAAEVAIDATSDQWTPNPLFALVPGAVVRWREPGDPIVLRRRVSHAPSDRYGTGAQLPPPERLPTA